MLGLWNSFISLSETETETEAPKGLAWQGKTRDRINRLRTTLRGYWVSGGVDAEENHEEVLSRYGDSDSARIMVRNAGCENGNLGGFSALPSVDKCHIILPVSSANASASAIQS